MRAVDRGEVYQNIDGLINGPFGDNVLDPGLVHVHGSAVLEDGACSVEVLGTVHLVGPVEEEVAGLIGHSWRARFPLNTLKKGRQLIVAHLSNIL